MFHPRRILPFHLRSLHDLHGSRLPMVYRLHPQGQTASARSNLVRDPALAQVEAALLVADEPLAPRQLVTALGLKDAGEARRLIRRLQAMYDQDGTAFQISEIGGGFQLLTRSEYHPWLVRLRQSASDLRLSQAARETLTIVAYRQPIMRADVEAIRGVQCGEILRMLMEKGLVRIAGRHHSLGRPVLYGTTRKFFQLFGLKDLEDLPLSDQLRSIVTNP